MGTEYRQNTGRQEKLIHTLLTFRTNLVVSSRVLCTSPSNANRAPGIRRHKKNRQGPSDLGDRNWLGGLALVSERHGLQVV